MKYGFMLTEVLVAAAIASLLSVSLFFIWGQINSAVRSAENRVHLYERILLVKEQLDRDITSICVPESRPYEKKKNEEKESKEKKAPEEVDPSSKLVPKIFFAQNRDHHFDHMTFLTSNAMQVYWSDKVGGAKPLIARVQYRLEKEKNSKKDSYVLYRQEAYTIDYDQFEKKNEEEVRSYALIHGIHQMKCTYLQEVVVQQESQKKSTQKKEVKTELKVLDAWDLEKELSATDSLIRPVPRAVQITLSLWDDAKERTHNVQYAIPVPIEILEKQTEQKSTESAPALTPQVAPSGLETSSVVTNTLNTQIDVTLTATRVVPAQIHKE